MQFMAQRSALKRLAILSVMLVLAASAVADVAPDPGYANVPADLILEANADLSEFRFFLQSPIRVEEVKLSSGSPTVISASGRGGASRYVSFIAVPRSDIGISGDLTESLLEDLVRRKTFRNAREVLTHNFQATVTVVEKPLWKPPVYRLTVENDIVKAKMTSGGAGGSLLLYAVPVIFAGVLIAIGIAIIGIWLFRRSRKKV
jgi:hypothetical protein